MAGKRLGKIRGTSRADELMGTPKKRSVYGLAGDDVIGTKEGRYKVYGGEGKDKFVTLNGGKGYMKIMDMEVGETIEFCGCASTEIKQRGKHVKIFKGDDIKAIVRNANADDFDMDFTSRLITMTDPLA
tara:strand:- start:63 stop:449 length:387 start_codon:yes stop_codon:yes gene_type:complete